MVRSRSVWSGLVVFDRVEKESCCTRNQKQEQQKHKLKKKKKKRNKTKEARPWIYRRRCEIYKVVKVEREGRLL